MKKIQKWVDRLVCRGGIANVVKAFNERFPGYGGLLRSLILSLGPLLMEIFHLPFKSLSSLTLTFIFIAFSVYNDHESLKDFFQNNEVDDEMGDDDETNGQ